MVILKDNTRYIKRPHIIGKDGYTLCGCNTCYCNAHLYWGHEYLGSASSCKCKKCLGVYINTQNFEQLKSYKGEINKMSIERKPITEVMPETPRFLKLKDTADLLEVGYDEFIKNINHPDVLALAQIAKIRIGFNKEYLEIIKDLPITIREMADKLKDFEEVNVYKNMWDEIFKIVKHYAKTLDKDK